MNTISLNNLWSYLQGLSLTANNQRWLAEHLIEAADKAENSTRKKEEAEPKQEQSPVVDVTEDGSKV